MQNALFVTCLDEPHPQLLSAQQAGFVDTANTLVTNQCLHGNGAVFNTCNRWFDSTSQVCVCTYVCIYVCACMCVHVCVCMYACVYVCGYVCVYVVCVVGCWRRWWFRCNARALRLRWYFCHFCQQICNGYDKPVSAGFHTEPCLGGGGIFTP